MKIEMNVIRQYWGYDSWSQPKCDFQIEDIPTNINDFHNHEISYYYATFDDYGHRRQKTGYISGIRYKMIIRIQVNGVWFYYRDYIQTEYEERTKTQEELDNFFKIYKSFKDKAIINKDLI